MGFMPVEIPKTALDLTALDYFDSPEEKAVKKEIAGLLRKHGGKYGSFLSALRNNDIDAVRQFLSNGTDINAKDDSAYNSCENRTSLRLASDSVGLGLRCSDRRRVSAI